MKHMNKATLVLSNHRPETVALAAALMRKHTAIFLEEPPDPQFRSMLAGDIPVEDYVMALDVEYPEFNQAMCHVLKERHQQGVPIFQVEPFLEKLIEIHEIFASGGSPRDLEKGSTQYRVYMAEKEATAALLDFYRSAAASSFEKTVAAVKRFARFDSQRFVVRDRMRADALAPMIQDYATAFIEAGQIHYVLWRMLRRRLDSSVIVKPHFIMAPIVKSVGVNRHLYAPGDILTLRYIFHPAEEDPVEDLLAARALIYNKLILKDEIAATEGHYPHTVDEIEVIETVRQLSLKDCADLFGVIRRANTPTARAIVQHHLSATGRKTFRLPQGTA
jgi:hypothetical protein